MQILVWVLAVLFFIAGALARENDLARQCRETGIANGWAANFSCTEMKVPNA